MEFIYLKHCIKWMVSLNKYNIVKIILGKKKIDFRVRQGFKTYQILNFE